MRDVCSTFNCGSSFKQFSQIDGNYSVSIASKNVFGQSTADSVTGIGVNSVLGVCKLEDFFPLIPCPRGGNGTG